MTTTDKPRADLVALLLQFETACQGIDRRQSLHLSGNEEGAAVRAWAELRGHRVQEEQRPIVIGGKQLRYTSLTVEQTATDWATWTVSCALHNDHEVTAQADQQMIARVQAALDGEQPADCSTCGAVHIDVDCFGEPIEQPEAAEGGV